AIGAVTIYTIWRPAVSGPPRRLLPFTGLPGLKGQPALSPEGNQMAFAWNGGEGESFSIYVKLVGTGTELRLTNTNGVDSNPAWSPDARFIAFHRQQQTGNAYYVVPALGGRERKLAASHAVPVSLGRTLDWSPDGKFLVAADAAESGGRLNLLEIAAQGGAVRPIL